MKSQNYKYLTVGMQSSSLGDYFYLFNTISHP